MPTGVYVRKNAVYDRLKAGMAADHAADFAQWLRGRRYTPLTIVERMRLLASWTHWARGEGSRFLRSVRRTPPRSPRSKRDIGRASAATSTRTRSSRVSQAVHRLPRGSRCDDAIANQIGGVSSCLVCCRRCSPLSWRLSRDGDGLAYHLLQPDSPALS